MKSGISRVRTRDTRGSQTSIVRPFSILHVQNCGFQRTVVFSVIPDWIQVMSGKGRGLLQLYHDGLFDVTDLKEDFGLISCPNLIDPSEV
jgi:hypothetical protein